MRNQRWVECGLRILLVQGLLLAGGCDDDDDEDPGTGGTVVTNIVNGNPVVVTNQPSADGNSTSGDGMLAPQLVSPANLGVVDLFKQDGTAPVDFRWAPVAGAASYVMELNGEDTTVAGTTVRKNLGMGEYEWRVWARNAAGAPGPASGKSRFGVMPVSFLAAPVVLEPDDGTVRNLYKQGGTVRVYFEWIPVAGADYYVVEINGVQAQVRMGDTVLIRDLGIGSYRWRLWSVDPRGRNGSAIPMRTLTVQSVSL